MIEAYLAREAAGLSQQLFEGAAKPAMWSAMRPRLKREFFAMLGLWAIPEKTPLQAQVTGTLAREGIVTIENLHFQSRPGLYVTGNLYRPKNVEGKLPAVLYVCGHASGGRDGCKTKFQDHGMWYGKNGYICLIIDTLQLGEIPGIHHGTYRYGRWWWQAMGYTPAGVECWNGLRAIDYLTSRPDVDTARIGVTGISGCGAATFWITAADDRVACAVPISGMSDLESYVSHKIINGHCDCMFLVNTDRWEWTTIAALVAPRPLLFANSDQDPSFPMDGNRRIIERLRQFYTMLDASQNIAEHVSQGGHGDRPDLRLATYRWMNAHLKQDSNPVEDAADPPIEGKRLRVFPGDRDLPGDARNATIDESFVTRPTWPLPGKNDFDEWKRARLADLRAASFRALPQRVAPARAKPPSGAEGHQRWLETEPGIEVAVLDLRPSGQKPPDRWTLVVLNEGESLAEVPDWARPIVGDDAVVVLAPRGVGPTAWTRKNPPNYVERALELLGRTVDAGRLHDILATRGWIALEANQGVRVRLAGRGPAGILAAYAALLGSPVHEVVAVEPLASHRDGPIFLNVLRVLDIPQALGLLAPATALSLVRASEDQFRATIELYRAADVTSQLHFR
jgi:dienelactone hydrolase